MSFLQLKGAVLFWGIVILLAFALLSGEFQEAGNLLKTLLIGMVAYQIIIFIIRAISGDFE